MSRWFRFYDDALNDPKLLKLSDRLHRVWVGMLCISSKHDGDLPPLEDIALLLRMRIEKVEACIIELTKAGLVDEYVGEGRAGIVMHNWAGRQYKSDVSTARVQRFRKQQRNVSETPPDTEQIQKQKDSEADASDAGASIGAPVDHRKRLFSEGLAALARITGKGPDACRSFVGKCLKAASDDAVTVLGLIEDAERNQTVDPTAWIVARLKPKENSSGRRTVHDAANDLIDRVQALDAPAPGSIRSGEGQGVVRLLPSR